MSAAGGGSRSPLWSQIRATVLDMPLRVAANADTAFGAALLAAAGSVHRDLAAASTAMVAPGALVEPDPAERDALERSYHRFVDALAERGWIAR
jgi:sugar (pentulose or hexulose) kinase